MTKGVPVLALALLAAACAEKGAERGGEDGGTAAVAAPSGSAPATPRVADDDVAPSEGADASHALFACLEGDRAVYSSPGEGGTGRKIHLWLAGDGIDGSSAPTGGVSDPVPIGAVRLIGADSVVLDLPQDATGSATVRFEGRVACDGLSGVERLGTAGESRPASYRRVR